MSASTVDVRVHVPVPGRASLRRLCTYLFADGCRRVQTTLGLLWLLDGALQLQPFMYSRGFLSTLSAGAAGQPHWLADSINWAVGLARIEPALLNSLFALTQLALGLGLLWRRTVRAALAGSLVWVLIVWWFGEAFGMLFSRAAQPLTGAPGAVLLYAIIALVAWPNGRPGGLIGPRGVKTTWALLWVMNAWLWLLSANSGADATHDALISTASGIGALTSLQRTLANAATGDGLTIALILALVSAAIGVAVAADWHPRSFLAFAIVLNTMYWILPQGLGGILAGRAADPNSGPLFVLLACSIYPLAGAPRAARPLGSAQQTTICRRPR